MSIEAGLNLLEDRLFYLGTGLIYKSVCAPKSWSPDKVSEEATKADPPGTSANKWVCAEVDGENIKENPIQCNDDCNRFHYVLNC